MAWDELQVDDSSCESYSSLSSTNDSHETVALHKILSKTVSLNWTNKSMLKCQ